MDHRRSRDPTPARRLRAAHFVMDYVRGESITTYCDRQRLPVRDRLELFIRLCGACSTRTRRASSIAIRNRRTCSSPIDDRPAVHHRLRHREGRCAQRSGTTLFTELGAVGTPDMSPEQADLSSLDDTRSDVYSLAHALRGVPRASAVRLKALRQAGFDEIRRTIRERSAEAQHADHPAHREHRGHRDGSAHAAGQAGRAPARRPRLITIKALERPRATIRDGERVGDGHSSASDNEPASPVRRARCIAPASSCGVIAWASRRWRLSQSCSSSLPR